MCLPRAPLESQLVSLVRDCGLETGGARRLVELLIEFDQMGVHSHGLWQLQRYLREFREGQLNPRAALTRLRETPSSAALCSDGGLGLLVLEQAMEIAISLALKTGVALVTTCNHGHLGGLGLAVRQATGRGLVALACGAQSLDPAWLEPALPVEDSARRNPPLAIGLPGQDADFVLDFGLKSRKPREVWAKFPEVFVWVFGLAHAVGLMADLGAHHAPPCPYPGAVERALLLVFSPELFGSVDRLKKQVGELFEQVSRQTPIPGLVATLPGGLEWELSRRLKAGDQVRIHLSTLETLQALGVVTSPAADW
ncbi:MAG: Ldh family oxidoreductase [Candidatus Eremiobacteraeota bacterium]|nr:Ldh family oxidoreductase [Candidatus Eremiobacteraeota bacterium]